MSRSHRLAWAAGFIDGDGFITIQNRRTTSGSVVYTGQYLRLGCCQAAESPLKELQSIFGGTIRIKNSGPDKENYSRKIQYIWTLSTKQAAAAIQQLLPYLVHKREVAILALQFQATMQYSKQKVTKETLEHRLLLKQQIELINSES